MNETNTGNQPEAVEKLEKQSTQEESSTNAQNKENSVNYSVINREQVENSPFWIITIEDKKHFIALGNTRCTEPTENKEELIQMIEEKDWNLLFQVIVVINKMIAKENK